MKDLTLSSCLLVLYSKSFSMLYFPAHSSRHFNLSTLATAAAYLRLELQISHPLLFGNGVVVPVFQVSDFLLGQRPTSKGEAQKASISFLPP